MSIIPEQTQTGAGKGTRPFEPPLKGEVMPAGLLGMYFFLASEAMFFVGLLGSFVVLESAGGQHALFVRSSNMLSPAVGVVSTILLLISSLGMKLRSNWARWIPLACSMIFLCCQITQWRSLMDDHTFIVRDGKSMLVLDGEVHLYDKPDLLRKVRQMDLPPSFNIHNVVRSDIGPASGEISDDGLYGRDVLQDLNYGSSRNNFFACYFLFTVVHVLHLIAGMIALVWFLIFPKPVLRYSEGPDPSREKSGSSEYLRDRRLGGIPKSVQIYWHFVNAVGVIGFAVLYFV